MTTNETARPVRDRDSRLKVGVSPEVRATIEARAAAAGLSVASYLRVAGLNQPLQRLADRQALDALVRLHGELGEVQRLAGLSGLASRIARLRDELGIQLERLA
ncbi:MAG: plasmid mobilization protein [Bacteroidota bacterium]